MTSSSSASNIGLEPGPLDGRVLYKQDSHISTEIWEKNIETKLETHNHNHFPKIVVHRVLRYVKLAGFYGLYMLGFAKLNVSLITALVERWRPETNTFHFTVGECTVTLQDVEVLAGVRIDGLSVIRSEKGENSESRKALIQPLLGQMPLAESFNKAGGLSMGWLKEHFNDMDLADDASDALIQCYARAFIIRILGSSYLQDKQGSHVPLFFLHFLSDLTLCGHYSWGSAILAFLYRALFKASVGKAKSINGSLTILQFWAWSRFSNLRPVSGPSAELTPYEGFPRLPYGRRWHDIRRHTDAGYSYSVRVWREILDKMQFTHVVWEPYAGIIEDLPDYCKAGSAIWRARVPLICIDVVERHYPDRVMRQFGMIQSVPQDTHRDDFTVRNMCRGGHSQRDWTIEHASYILLWEQRAQFIVPEVAHNKVNTVAPDYMRWYQHITRRWIGPIMKIPLDRGVQRDAGIMELMFQGLGACYDIFRDIPHAEGIATLELLFAQLGMIAPQAPRQPHLMFSQQPRTAPERAPIPIVDADVESPRRKRRRRTVPSADVPLPTLDVPVRPADVPPTTAPPFYPTPISQGTPPTP